MRLYRLGRTSRDRSSEGLGSPTLYRLLNWHGPRTYAGKLLLITLVVEEIPLLALIAYVAMAPLGTPPRWPIILGAIALALLGTLVARWAVRALGRPLLLSHQVLVHYLDTGERRELPSDLSDEVGVLMRDVAYTIDRFHEYRLRLEEYAAVDALTGLLNRRAAEDRLRQSFGLQARTGGSICVAMLDIDRFKFINDRHGHAAGDRVLAAVATVLRESMRESDWAARWGGEEFLLLLHTDLAGAATTLERLRIAIASLEVRSDGSLLTCTISGGCSAAAPGESRATVIQRADAALYEAKNHGRNRIWLAPPPPGRPGATPARET